MFCNNNLPCRFLYGNVPLHRRKPGFIIDAITALFKEGKLYIDDSGQWSTDFDEDADYSRLYIPPSMHEAVWKHINTLDKISYETWKQFLLLTCLSL